MQDEVEKGCCARDACAPACLSDVEQLMHDFLDCDTGTSTFGGEEARRLRAALRQDSASLEKFFKLFVQDRLLTEFFEE